MGFDVHQPLSRGVPCLNSWPTWAVWVGQGGRVALAATGSVSTSLLSECLATMAELSEA